MKPTLIWFNLQRDGTGNGLLIIKDTFAEQAHMMAGQNIKKKYVMRQIPIKMLK